MSPSPLSNKLSLPPRCLNLSHHSISQPQQDIWAPTRQLRKYYNVINGQDSRNTSRHIFTVAIAVKSELDLQRPTDILSLTGGSVTHSIRLVWIFSDHFRYQTTVNIFCYSAMTSPSGMNPLQSLMNEAKPLPTLYSTTGIVASDALKAYIPTEVETSSPNFSSN